MRFDELNDSNYLLFAIKNYDNPQAVTQDDFYDDLKRIKYIKRLLKRYRNTGELRTHLILNHFIVLFNVFGDAGVPLLFFKLDKELWTCTKSFLTYLGRIPDYPRTELNSIQDDDYCLEQLRTV
jgi:hypothetical protein|tara:strand:+ start:345 stop:716 length:372 start_codon:yes stop_codon:yes gene_type:complete